MYSSNAYSASASFTPAAASHTAGDSVGTAAEFKLLNMVGSAPSNGAGLMITSASLMIADATAAATAWRLYLFNVTPRSCWHRATGHRSSAMSISARQLT
jgi:hypothetical protein